MSTPQDPPVRSRQKKRRTKQLAEWRAKKAQGKDATARKAPDAKSK